MRLLRSLTPVLAVVGTILLLAAVTVQAGAEATYIDQCKFRLNTILVQNPYIEGTANIPVTEIATLDFTVEFEPGITGYLSTAIVKFRYDPTKVALFEAVPAANWNGVGVNDTTLRFYPQGQMTQAVYTITKGSSYISMSTSQSSVAQFKFHILCQSTYSVDDVTIEKTTGGTCVTSGNNFYFVEGAGRTFDGRIAPEEYWYILNLADIDGLLEFEAALGTDILVPLIGWTNFRVGDVDMFITYDNTRLQWLNVETLSENFVDESSHIESPGVIHIHLMTDEAISSRREFDPRGKVLDLKFHVLGTWEGSSTTLGFQGWPTFEIAQFDGTCTLAQINMRWADPGDVSITPYHVTYTSSYPDAQGANVSVTDNSTTVQLNLTNNFPIGATVGDDPALIANVALQPGLTPTTAYSPDFYLMPTQEQTGWEVTARLKTTARSFNASATPQSMVTFAVSADAPPTSFDSHRFSVRYQKTFDGLGTGDARARDITGGVTLLVTDSLTDSKLKWDTTYINYLMGEYFCPSVSAGAGLISQDYFTRSSFDLNEFKVKIVVTGAHNIYSVTPMDGVVIDSYDANHRWVILKNDIDWIPQAAGDTRIKFATITYCYWGQSQLNLSQPGPTGHWETRSSTVSFVCDSIQSPGYYYMKDPDGVNQHRVAIGGSVVSSWWVSGLPQNDLVGGADGLPTDYALAQNYPNPFNPTTEFWYALPEGTNVEITIYNITGQKVATLVNGWREAGFYRETWNGEDLASGVYFYRLQTDLFTDSKKMILLK